jgi:hypothetical protein
MATYTLDPITGLYVLSADVSTDQPDYSPGSTVQISANFDPGSIVQLNVAHDIGAGADGIWGTADDVLVYDLAGTVLPWTVTADAAGAINTSWFVNSDALGQAFVLTATELGADGTATGPVATTFFTDSAPNLDPTATLVPLNTLASSTTINGAIFAQSSSALATGTGVFNAFLGIQNNGSELGYNTGGGTVLDDKHLNSAHTTTVQLNEIGLVDSAGNPTTTGGDGSYRKFLLDIHQSGSNPLLSLDALQIYTASASDLLANSTLTAANGANVPTSAFTDQGLSLVYNMDGGIAGDVSVQITSEFDAGSGKFDYVILIPDSYFAGAQSSDYVYLYSAFGYQGGDYAANSTFEEFGFQSPAGTTTTGSTPDAVLGIDKQISIDGGQTWEDVGLYIPNTDSAAAPTLLTGSAVNYQVRLTNLTTPNASDSDPLMTLKTLTDDNGPSLTAVVGLDGNNIGDANHDGNWDVGETWVYAGSTTAAHGLQIDTVTATGTVTDSNGTSDSPAVSDQANYIGVTPKIAIDKVTVDGTLDASGNLVLVGGKGAAGDHLTIIKGESITWEYKVTNPGDVALSNVTVTDNQAGVSPTGLLQTDLIHNVGDTNDNGLLDTNETWIYTAAGTAIDGTYTNTGTAGGSFTDDAHHTATPTASDNSGYTGVDPEIHIVKTTTGNIDATHTATGDGLSFLAGYAVTWNYTVTNAGDVSLSNVGVTDNQAGVSPTGILQADHLHNVGDINDNGLLDVGESWTFTASGTAILGSYSNIGTASGSFTDTALHTATPTATDPSSYTGTFTEQGGTLTQGFWGSHTDAWDNIAGNEGNPTKSAFASHVLSSLDVNPSTDTNLLLGDTNHNGVADDAHDLWISIKLAASIESSSTSGDARMIMLDQAIAAQLNIDNGKAEPNAVIDEAVMWLTKQGAWSTVGVNVATGTPTSNGNGTGGMVSTVAENGAHTALAGSSVSTSSTAWNSLVHVTDAASYTGASVSADGEGLKNALMWWNDGHLVTTAAGQVAYDPDGTGAGGVNPATIHLNTIDEFWLTLHQQTGLTGIS